MIYKAPFYAMSKAVYGALSASNVGLQWFDSSVPINEIENNFKGQAEFAYGIFGSANADCESNKDTAVWTADLSLEIYSNYKGRKVISQKLEGLLNYLSNDTGWRALQSVFVSEGYQLLAINIGNLTINPPIYSDIGVWQSGSALASFKIEQLEEA